MGCSVNGVVIFRRKRTREQLAAIEQRLIEIVVAATDRGRDSYGFAVIKADGTFNLFKREGRYDGRWPRDFLDEKTVAVINNCRAEPTTEWVRTKTEDDIQPFATNGIIVSHNGVIANDRQLAEKFTLDRVTKVDSAILPGLFQKTWDGNSLDSLVKSLEEIVGSYALAICDTRKSDQIFLAANYKPLYIQLNSQQDVLYFTSLEDYIDQGDFLQAHLKCQQLPPYSATKISTTGHIETKNANFVSRRALCVCSSGLDSTIAATYAKKVLGCEIRLMHFLYGCRAEQNEKVRIPRIAEALECDHVYVQMDVFKNIIGHSRLTETASSVVKDRDGEVGAELALEWVPARNLIMLSVATGYAEANGFDTIVIGNNLEEAGAFPDNEMIFIEKFNEILPYAVNVNKKVKVVMPVGNLMKHEIVRLGSEMEAPVELTWSCYEGGVEPCGSCGPCFMRRVGFEMNNLQDPAIKKLRNA